MRLINEIVVHCTATPDGREFSVAQIDAMHRQRGFDGIGYHYLIGLDGTVREGRPVERAGAHVAGRNANTIGISYVGGIDRAGKPKDTRTAAQKRALLSLITELCERFPSIMRVSGHREYANKACPCFDARAEYGAIPKRRGPAVVTPERYRLKGAVSLLSEPMGDVVVTPPKNAVVATTGERSGDWVQVIDEGSREIAWTRDDQINQREAPAPRATSRTLWGNVMGAFGVGGSLFSQIGEALGPVKEYAPWIMGAAVFLTVAGLTLSTLAKLQDGGAGVVRDGE